MAIGTVATTTMAIRPVSRGDGLYSSCQLARYPDVFSDVIHIVLDLHQEVLQWVKVVTLNIEEGIEPVVPEP